MFSFLAEPARPGPVRLTVLQTYSDGSIVAWNGPESSQAPAPTILAVASLTPGSRSGGGGTSVLTIVAVVLAVLALAASGLALLGSEGRGRPRRESPGQITLGAVLLVSALGAALPSVASAHAYLVRTSPAASRVLNAAPSASPSPSMRRSSLALP